MPFFSHRIRCEEKALTDFALINRSSKIDFMCSSCCNRRKLLKRSLQTISLLALGSCQKSSSLVSPIDLRAQESSKIQADTLQVLAVRGIAQTQKLLKVGDQVFSGEVVELDKDSEMILGAPDKVPSN